MLCLTYNINFQYKLQDYKQYTTERVYNNKNNNRLNVRVLSGNLYLHAPRCIL